MTSIALAIPHRDSMSSWSHDSSTTISRGSTQIDTKGFMYHVRGHRIPRDSFQKVGISVKRILISHGEFPMSASYEVRILT